MGCSDSSTNVNMTSEPKDVGNPSRLIQADSSSFKNQQISSSNYPPEIQKIAQNILNHFDIAILMKSKLEMVAHTPDHL